MNKRLLFFHRAFFVILLICPFALGSIYCIISLLGGWEFLFADHANGHYFLPEFRLWSGMAMFLLYVVIASFLVVLCIKYTEKRKSKFLASILICFGITVILRIFIAIPLWNNILPFSDFKLAWDRANGDYSSISYYRFFPAYMNYSLVLRLLSIASVGDYNIVTLFSIFCNGMTSCLIYAIALEIYPQKNKVGLVAALLYAFYPTSIVYSLIATPEHLSILCLLGSVLFITKMINSKDKHLPFFYAVCAGILGGISNSIKTFFPIVLVALIIVILFFFDYKKHNLKHFMVLLCCFLLVFVTEKVIVYLITKVSENVFRIELDFADATPHFFNVGLNRAGEGQIHLGNLSRIYIQDRVNGMSLQAAQEATIKRLADDWNGHFDEVIPFLMQKTIWAWQDDVTPFRYLQSSIDVSQMNDLCKGINSFLSAEMIEIAQYIYLLLMLWGCIGTVQKIKVKAVINHCELLVCLLIVGYFCLTLFSEAQSRYKCMIIPCICIFDASTIFDSVCLKRKCNV